MKRIWIPLILLFSVSTLMLLYQWDRAEAGSEKVSKLQDLEISMTVKENQLHFAYTYEQVKAGIYTLEIPEKATEIVCSQKESPCRITNQKNPEMILEMEGEVFVDYTMPMPENEVINDWMIKLKKDDRVMHSTFSLTIQDFDEVKDPWLVPSKKQSDIQMENLHYYKFPSINEPLPMARKGEASLWHVGNSIVTYEAGTELAASVKQEIQNFLEGMGPVLIQLDQSVTKVSSNHMKVEGRDIEELQAEYVVDHLRKVTAEANPWELKVVKNIFTRNNSLMASEVAASLTKDELMMWKERLLQAENIKDLGVYLDEALSTVFGAETSFFRNYEAPTEDNLYFVESRHVFNHGQLVSDRIVHYHGSPYLALPDLSRVLNYKLTEIEKSKVYLLEVPGKEYRFYVDQPTFIVNNESFGMGQKVLVMVEDSPFINWHDLQELVDINLTTGSDFEQKK
ncbi:hypothetical protein GLV98_04960 [Halobacillus litoralis]|uniref:Copper amine oxidase-like N-terminal domain-containing protein n=1 Tax=Halobacillus litoralis TaxID=45668 RepID=A0A845E0P5_9BACI|nr:hypothetical protein [Halobacillus litoralis]MYL48820.1 hypothetical protein [Halobacillus litoralis]